MSSVARATPRGPGHGAAVSEAARSDCGRPAGEPEDEPEEPEDEPEEPEDEPEEPEQPEAAATTSPSSNGRGPGNAAPNGPGNANGRGPGNVAGAGGGNGPGNGGGQGRGG